MNKQPEIRKSVIKSLVDLAMRLRRRFALRQQRLRWERERAAAAKLVWPEEICNGSSVDWVLQMSSRTSHYPWVRVCLSQMGVGTVQLGSDRDSTARSRRYALSQDDGLELLNTIAENFPECLVRRAIEFIDDGRPAWLTVFRAKPRCVIEVSTNLSLTHNLKREGKVVPPYLVVCGVLDRLYRVAD